MEIPGQSSRAGLHSAGYGYLQNALRLEGMPHWRSSFVSLSGARGAEFRNGVLEETYPRRYWPGEGVGDHLVFALKYDGVNLGLLSRIFDKAPREDIAGYVRARPTGKYARRIWFFYEGLTGRKLPLPNSISGNYVDALETAEYYTVQNGEKSPRHRIVNNLLGPLPGLRGGAVSDFGAFCPIIRKTERLSELDADDLRKKCEAITSAHPSELLRRALSYLYNKETKSSFEIEHITPNSSRTEKFIAALALAEREDFCEKERLIELQNRIVDSRFTSSDYRRNQNYVGQTVVHGQEIIHFIGPKPDDLQGLMAGLMRAHRRMREGNVPPLIHAAAIAWGFVFLHPFEDGNGRIHRFLIHNILSLRGMVPRGLILPVSAVMLKYLSDYDASLEAFSRPLLQLINYQLNETGRMTVRNDTACWYRYMDMTAQAEALSEFVSRTIEEDLAEELNFLASLEHTKRAIQNIADMPDYLIDLFIRLCLQNNGSLSARKRSAHFTMLTNEECTAMEQAVNKSFTDKARGRGRP
ncbi:MAG: Fic family protein [Salinispira sp.]